MKLLIEREVLHQLARAILGTRDHSNSGVGPQPVSNVSPGRIRDAAEAIAKATAASGAVLQVNTTE